MKMRWDDPNHPLSTNQSQTNQFHRTTDWMMHIIQSVRTFFDLHHGMFSRILSRTMRYSPEHKTEVHKMIVKDASRRVRAEGLAGAAVQSIMRDTGLTHGGFYKHFANKDALLVESLGEAFIDIGDALARVTEKSPPESAWKAIVRTYLSLEFCDHPERACPLSALAPELTRVGKKMRGQIFPQLVSYKDRMLPFMPGRRAADKERAFFQIFSTMVGATEIARMLPTPALREKVLAAAKDLLFSAF
jgi:TetR/AcrR family transcriptional repressor of nem operon